VYVVFENKYFNFNYFLQFFRLYFVTVSLYKGSFNARFNRSGLEGKM